MQATVPRVNNLTACLPGFRTDRREAKTARRYFRMRERHTGLKMRKQFAKSKHLLYVSISLTLRKPHSLKLDGGNIRLNIIAVAVMQPSPQKTKTNKKHLTQRFIHYA